MPTDYTNGIDEFTRFAEQGDPQAQFRLGVMYGLGLGVEQSYHSAIEWYQKSAQAGNPRAQCNLGWMYGTGRGVPQNFVSALAWYSIAAAAGDEVARSNRDILNLRMTPYQVERSQAMAQDLVQDFAARDNE
ncbi:MAG: sel1 repeat family protein [Chromatiales bacterium]|nr:sel1 repeat family protein [Chromatiales bacterium]